MAFGPLSRRTFLRHMPGAAVAAGTLAAVPATANPEPASAQQRFKDALDALMQAAREMNPSITAWAIHRKDRLGATVPFELVGITDEAIADAERYGDTLGYCLRLDEFVHYRRGQLARPHIPQPTGIPLREFAARMKAPITL